ncbi:MAG TPA: PQQ-binding-like beta-propeller repeat protein [bacterium]|nr:PQQ-binding-like beta-propeller repeat protein [bacterium]
MRRFLPALALAALALAACSGGRPKLWYPSPGAAGWPTPRADQANSGRAPQALPDVPYTVAWSVKTGGVAASEPVVRDGLVFFPGLDRRIEVYDLASGKRRFRKRLDGPVLGVLAFATDFAVLTDQEDRRFVRFDMKKGKERADFRVHSASAPPRLLNDSTILISTWSAQVRALTPRGEILWETECEGPIRTAPAVVDSVVYAASGRSLFALAADDGSILWQHGVSGAIEGVAVDGGQLFFGGADSFVTALDCRDGHLLWNIRLGGGIFATPAVGSDLIYVAANDGRITALDRQNGQIRWDYALDAIANLSPTLSNDLLLVTARNALVTALSAATGEVVWADTTLSGQAVIAPIIAGDRILLADSKRNLICLAPATSTAN